MTDESARPAGGSGTPPGPPEDPPPGTPGQNTPPGTPGQSTPPGTSGGPGHSTPPGGPGGPGGHIPPGAAGRPGWGTPPPGSAAFAARYGLVRPLGGRYLGGVCAAIGRATGTDPVVWRVLLGVLTFFGGLGLLVYLVLLLATPAEGDTAAPVEAMFGRGSSSMSPLTVAALGAIAVIGFAFIVTDSFRAMLLGAAILVGGALLLSRSGTGLRAGGPGSTPGQPTGAPPPFGAPQPPYGPAPWGAPQSAYGPTPVGHPDATRTAAATSVPDATAAGLRHADQSAAEGSDAAVADRRTPEDDDATGQLPGDDDPTRQLPGDSADPTRQLPGTGRLPEIGAGPATAAFPAIPAPAPWPGRDEVTAVLPAAAPGGTPTGGTDLPGEPGWGQQSAFGLPPQGGYRPPFAPHGPYGTGAAPPLPPVPPPRQPRPSSPLGAATFWMIFVVLGLVATLELTGVADVSAAGYFAAALATIGLGLLIGTWFGRARWLIALGLTAAVALGVAGATEAWAPINDNRRDVTWAPAGYAALAPRYENSVGDSVLDLRGVDFTGQDTQITVVGSAGSIVVYLPDEVDVTATSVVNVGENRLFGYRWSGVGENRQKRTDLGRDGAGGGTLRLDVRLNVGNVEVTR